MAFHLPSSRSWLASAVAALAACSGGTLAEGPRDSGEGVLDATDAQEEHRTERDGPAGDAPDAGGRVLVEVLSGAPWGDREGAARIAVDGQDHVYVLDTSSVYMVADSTISTYLTVGEAQMIAGAPTTDQLDDLDIAADGSLLILMDDAVIQSTAAHQGTVLYALTTAAGFLFPRRLGAIAPGRAAVTDNKGLHVITASSSQLVYDAGQVGSGQGCVVDDLAMAYSGVFLYQVGCNDSPLLRGNTDGSGIMTLYGTSQPGVFDVSNFYCTARDPAGGFYTLVSDSLGPALYHVAESAQGSSGLTAVATAPSFSEAQTFSSGLDYCSLAVATDGTLFLKTLDELWRIDP